MASVYLFALSAFLGVLGGLFFNRRGRQGAQGKGRENKSIESTENTFLSNKRLGYRDGAEAVPPKHRGTPLAWRVGLHPDPIVGISSDPVE